MIHSMSHFSIAGALAADQHRRFLAEAQQTRRLAQLDRVRGRGTTESGFITELRNEVATWTGHYQTWRTTWWPDRLSMPSKS